MVRRAQSENTFENESNRILRLVECTGSLNITFFEAIIKLSNLLKISFIYLLYKLN